MAKSKLKPSIRTFNAAIACAEKVWISLNFDMLDLDKRIQN
jgi:hypothetical protein